MAKSKKQAEEEERSAAAVSLGRRGGQARARNLTPAQRSAIAKKGAIARWGAKKKGVKKAVKKETEEKKNG